MRSKVTKPWYVPRTTGAKRLLERIALALGLIGIDDIPSTQYNDEGYRLEELGPHRWRNGVCILLKGAQQTLRVLQLGMLK